MRLHRSLASSGHAERSVSQRVLDARGVVSRPRGLDVWELAPRGDVELAKRSSQVGFDGPFGDE